MGAKQSNERRNYAVPPPQMSETQVQCLLEIQRQQYERKLEEMAAQRRQEEAAKAAEQRRQEEAAKAVGQRRQEEAAKAAEERRQKEAAKAAEQRRQEEAAKAAEQRRQEKAAKAAEERRQKEAAKAAEQRRQEEASKAAEQRRQEEAAKAAEQRRQEEAAKAAEQRRQEEAAKAAEQRRQEVAAKAAEQRRQEEAAKAAEQRRQEAAKAAEQRRQEAAKAAEQKRQEEAAKVAALRKQQEEAVAAAQRRQQKYAAKAAAFSIERERTPYSLCGNQLQQAAAAPTFLYPNLNQGHAIPNAGPFHSNPFQYRSPNATFENLMNTCNQGFRSAPSAPAPPRGPSPRPRSVSRPRNAAKERDVLDCPTCHARYGMRTFQCDNGHSSCDDCKNRRRPCGICRKPLTNRRNYDLENHIAQTKAPCPHTSEGCKLYIKIADMETHVKECPFKEQKCPLTDVFGTCHWKGKLSEISSHFDSMHPNGCQTKVDSEMQLTNIRNNSQQVHLSVLGVYNFLLHIKVSENDGKVYMAVQLIGTKFSAQKWLYEIHVYNKSENRRKYVFTDNCCSSNDKIEDVFNTGECAVLPVWYAKTFICNGTLTYKFFIKKSDEGKKMYGKNNRGRGRNH